ncbi:hypothetical protein C4J87_3503 [Pseudomonas sp. R1-43-08]|uniref:hypothetical protein n=1 Tax=Pseudomonas sp. R1-43-08 TaxID=1173270 RepID=UPI000F5709A6|nr:hypothetical protein [Pseudomonas sp. R1-43-08]AZF43645.1 hypothetical protein C4J87_3503 [Pseudomonas sp. R1-43-08]
MASKIPAKKTGSIQTANSLPAVEAELPYAIIEHAANNSLLYPIDAINGTKATLTLPANATNVMFYMAVKDQDQPSFEPISVENGINVVDIPARWVSYCIGHTVLIKYTANAGGRALESLTLELEIQQIREEHLVVSRPVFTHAKEEWSTWYLRMQEFTGDEIVAIKAWPMIQPGQRLFVVVAGNQHVAPYRFAWVARDHVVQEHEAHPDHVFRFTLSRGWLSRLDDYSAITAHLGVIWDTTAPVYPAPGDPLLENPLPVNAEDFHLRTTSLLLVDPGQELNPPHLKESVELPPGQWQVNPTNTVNGGHAIVSYDGMFEGDHVCAYASGPNYAPVALGCQDVKKDETSLSYDVAPDIVAALFDKTLTLNYSLQFNSYLPQSSPDRHIKVLAPHLTTPDIEEATMGTVNLTTFNNDATGVVPLFDYAKEGQCCWMWLTGVDEDGAALQLDVLQDVPLKPHWLIDGVDTSIARNTLKKLADCSDFKLHFAASFDGQCDRSTAREFPARSFTIVQEQRVLKAPTVHEAVGNELTVWNGRNGVHVEVSYLGNHPNHTLSLCWTKPDGACWPLDSQPGSASGTTTFLVPREAVIESIGKTVKISYTVTSACKVQTSDDLNLHISVPVRLPTPVVEQATPRATQYGILDLATFPADALITVETWWFALAGQRVWLKCTGIKKDGTEHTFYVVKGLPLTAEESQAGLSQTMSRSDILLLKHNSPLTVTCITTPDSNDSERDSITFPVLNLIVKRQLICQEERFEGLAQGTFAAGGSVQTKLMKITFQSGAGLAGIATYGNDNYYSGNHFVMCQHSDHQIPPQLHRFDFSRELESVRFSWSWKQRPGTVTFYGPTGNVVRQETYTEDWRGGFWVELATSPGTSVAWMTVLVQDYSFIDNFSMCYRE